MANLRDVCKPNRKSSRWNPITEKPERRFYSSRDMAEVKHMVAQRNSQIKRGETPDFPNNYISVCGCGNEGCFIVYGYYNR
jgi:hypothetical protein